MGNTNEASKADLNKGIIGVFRLCHFDRMLLHGCRLLSSVPCGVPHFMGALYRFKSAKSTAKTAKFRSRFCPIFVNSTNPSPTSSIALLTANVGAAIVAPFFDFAPHLVGADALIGPRPPLSRGDCRGMSRAWGRISVQTPPSLWRGVLQRRSRRDSFTFWLRQNHKSSGCGLPFYIGTAVDATAE